MKQYSEKDAAQMAALLKSSIDAGLDEEEATARLARDASLRQKEKSPYSLWAFIKKLFRRLSPLLLTVSVLLAFLTGERREASVFLLLYTVFVLFLLSLWLYCAGVSAQVEKQMRQPLCCVRQGKKKLVPQEELVVGDLVVLQEGTVLPFSAYLVSGEEITVWTRKGGRHYAVKKRGGAFFESENPPNILKQGDIVREGQALAFMIAPHKEAFIRKTDERMPAQLLSIGSLVSRVCYLLAFLMLGIAFFVFKDSADVLRVFFLVSALTALSPLEWLDFLAEAIFYIKNAALLRKNGCYVKSLRRAHRVAHADCYVLPAAFFVSGETTYVNSFLNGTGNAVSVKKGSAELSFVASCLCSMERGSGARQKMLSSFFASCAQEELPELLGFCEVGNEKSYASVASFRFGSQSKPFSLVGGDAAFLLSHILYAKENGRTHLLDAKTKEKILSAVSLYKTNGYRVVAYAQTSFVPREKGEKISFDSLCDMRLCGFLVLGALPNREINDFLHKTAKEGKKAVVFYNGADPSNLLESFSKKFVFHVLLGNDPSFENKVASFVADETMHFLLLCGASSVQKAGTVRALEALGYSVSAYGETFEEHRMLSAARSAISAPFSRKEFACGATYETAEAHAERRIFAFSETQSVAKDMVGAVSTLTVTLSLSLVLRTLVVLFGVLFSHFLLSSSLLTAFGVAIDLSVAFCLVYARFPKGSNGEERKNLSHVFAWISAAVPSALSIGGIAVCVGLWPSSFPFSPALFVSLSLILLLNASLLTFTRIKATSPVLFFVFYSVFLVGLLLLTGAAGALTSMPTLFSLLCWVLLPFIVFVVAEKLLQIFFKNHIKLKEIYYE